MGKAQYRKAEPALMPHSFSIGEAAALIGIGRKAVRERIARGSLHAVRLGRTRIPRSEIERVCGYFITPADVFRAQQVAKAKHRQERERKQAA